MSDYETCATTREDLLISRAEANDPPRPDGEGWRLVGVVRADWNSGCYGAVFYWERERAERGGR